MFTFVAEERQDQNAKRRKVEQQVRNGIIAPSAALGLTSGPTPVHPSLPPRPTYDFAATADSIGLGAAATPESIQMKPVAAQALAGSNRDVVANIRAIRMANMSAAEMLKAELAGLQPVKSGVSSLPPKPAAATISAATQIAAQLPPKPITTATEMTAGSLPVVERSTLATDDMEVDEFGRVRRPDGGEDPTSGQKRKFEEGPGAPEREEDVVTVEENDDEDAPPDSDPLAYKVNSDGTVTQEDTVRQVKHLTSCFVIHCSRIKSRLWEPGYKERYYKQKFGVETNDVEFKRK